MMFLKKFTVTSENILIGNKNQKTLLGLLIEEMGPNKGIAIDFQENNQIVIFPIIKEGHETKMEILGKVIKKPSIEKIEKEIQDLINNPSKNYY